MPRLTQHQRDVLLAPCVCGHTLNDHGGYVACYLCEEDGDECGTPFEELLVERIERLVGTAWEQSHDRFCPRRDAGASQDPREKRGAERRTKGGAT